MGTDNYPPGFDQRQLDLSLDDFVLPEEKQQVKYTLIVECGEDEEQVFKMSCYDSDEVESSLLRKAQHAVEEWQDSELRYLIDRFGEDDDL